MTVLLWGAVWQLASLTVGSELILPSPVSTVRTLLRLAAAADFWTSAALSLCRILAGFALGVLISVPLAALTWCSRTARGVFSLPLSVIRATPVATFILLAFFWLGVSFIPSFVAMLMVIPIMWSGVVTGLDSTSPELYETVRMFGYTRGRIVRELYVPSALPSVRAALVTSVGLAWKAGVAAEVIAVPKLSIGKHMYEAKLYLETTELFAWTLAVIIISLTAEKALTLALGRKTKNGGGKDAACPAHSVDGR